MPISRLKLSPKEKTKIDFIKLPTEGTLEAINKCDPVYKFLRIYRAVYLQSKQNGVESLGYDNSKHCGGNSGHG